MNQVILMGNLGRDVDVRVVNANGKQTTVATCVMAVNRRFKKGDGEWGEHTNWMPLELWDAGAETFSEKCCKGDRILIHGSLKSESWEKDGQRHSRLLVRVDKFWLLNKKGGNSEQESQNNDVESDSSF